MGNYLVFGAAGTLGQSLLAVLMREGHTACGVLHGTAASDMRPADSYIEGCDVRLPDSVQAAFDTFAARHGCPDCVVDCAGVTAGCDFAGTSPEEWDRVFDTNFGGAVNICRSAARAMRGGGGNRSIVLIGSGYGERFIPGLASYCVSKAALSGLVRALSVELAPQGVRINLVTPGLFPSKMTQPFVEDESYIRQLMPHIPDGSLGDAGELAEIVYFLTTAACRHVNGINIAVDGGMLNRVEGGIVR